MVLGSRELLAVVDHFLAGGGELDPLYGLAFGMSIDGVRRENAEVLALEHFPSRGPFRSRVPRLRAHGFPRRDDEPSARDPHKGDG
ncbi:hypothetical protein [Amycolatopsis sp. cmx-11-32]|uniref:hypothetical protein n=1 Tax=Amycolatopsis sp. cmx-11-32 TaxID=2785796 RepID=UPI0039E3E74B